MINAAGKNLTPSLIEALILNGQLNMAKLL